VRGVGRCDGRVVAPFVNETETVGDRCDSRKQGAPPRANARTHRHQRRACVVIDAKTRASDPNRSRCRSRGDRSWTRTRELTSVSPGHGLRTEPVLKLADQPFLPVVVGIAPATVALSTFQRTRRARGTVGPCSQGHPQGAECRERDGSGPPCARPGISRCALTRDCWSDDAMKTKSGASLTRDLFTGSWIEPDAVGDALPRRRPDGEPNRLTVSPGVADLSGRVFGETDPIAVV